MKHIIDEVKEQYKTMAAKSREEAEQWYKNKVGILVSSPTHICNAQRYMYLYSVTGGRCSPLFSLYPWNLESRTENSVLLTEAETKVKQAVQCQLLKNKVIRHWKQRKEMYYSHFCFVSSVLPSLGSRKL